MKIIRHIPNTITLLNLLSGSFAVVLSFYGNFKGALLCIIIAALFDFCDGFAARLLKAYSPLGKELDSLADMVSFGLAPAMILFNKILQLEQMDFADLTNMDGCEMALALIPLLCALSIALFSALRLAKFNIDTRQSENFIGLATPSCALIVGSLIYASESYPQINQILMEQSFILPVIAVALSLLLVCEIPMFSFKFKSLGWNDNKIKFIFLICAAVIAAVECIIMRELAFSVIIFSIFTFYIVMNVAIWICNRSNREN